VAFHDRATGRLCGSEVRWLTAGQLAEIRRLWAAGATQAEIAVSVDVSIDRLRARMGDQLADLPKRGRGTGGGRRESPPTPEEIHERAAMLRHGWPAERWLDPLGSAADGHE
jgi:hypothetical protein